MLELANNVGTESVGQAAAYKQVCQSEAKIMEKIISKSVITAIPGIGIKYAKRLDAAGIKKVSFFKKKSRDTFIINN